MDLNVFVDGLRRDLAQAADAGGAEARAVGERLVAPLESAVRLMLLEALSAAAAEITVELAPGSVDLRLRGRDPSFVVTLPPVDDVVRGAPTEMAEPTRTATDADDSAMSRINLRLPQDLKERVEDAARGAGLSVNAWLVRAAAAALDTDNARPSEHRVPTGGDRYTGWVR